MPRRVEEYPDSPRQHPNYFVDQLQGIIDRSAKHHTTYAQNLYAASISMPSIAEFNTEYEKTRARLSPEMSAFLAWLRVRVGHMQRGDASDDEGRKFIEIIDRFDRYGLQIPQALIHIV